MEKLPIWVKPASLEIAETRILDLGRTMHQHAYLLGKELVWVKERLGHGNFLSWIEKNVWFSQQTVSNVMRFALRCDTSRALLEYHPGKLPTIGNSDVGPLPPDKYRTIIIVPPWPMEKIQREVRPSQTTMDYPPLTLDAIANLPIQDLADLGGCHVYLWFTQKYRREAFALFDKWEVKDECFLTWVKNVGFTPYSWMYSTEHILFGRIGNLKLDKLGVRLDFNGKVREHSRKPDEFYEIVKQVSPAPRMELFAREPRQGFEVWGNETRKFGTLQ